MPDFSQPFQPEGPRATRVLLPPEVKGFPENLLYFL